MKILSFIVLLCAVGYVFTADPTPPLNSLLTPVIKCWKLTFNSDNLSLLILGQWGLISKGNCYASCIIRELVGDKVSAPDFSQQIIDIIKTGATSQGRPTNNRENAVITCAQDFAKQPIACNTAEKLFKCIAGIIQTIPPIIPQIPAPGPNPGPLSSN